jgi:hypothetical protein
VAFLYGRSYGKRNSYAQQLEKHAIDLPNDVSVLAFYAHWLAVMWLFALLSEYSVTHRVILCLIYCFHPDKIYEIVIQIGVASYKKGQLTGSAHR